MVDAGGGCIGWGARDRDLMRGTVVGVRVFVTVARAGITEVGDPATAGPLGGCHSLLES